MATPDRSILDDDTVGARCLAASGRFPALAAVSDMFFPRVFLRRGVAAVGNDLDDHLLPRRQPHLDQLSDDYILGTAHANRFARGFFDQSAQLWSRDGALIATTYQIVYFKG